MKRYSWSAIAPMPFAFNSAIDSAPSRFATWNNGSNGGTADALLQTSPLIEDRCLVLNGDDLYHRHDLQAPVEASDRDPGNAGTRSPKPSGRDHRRGPSG